MQRALACCALSTLLLACAESHHDARRAAVTNNPRRDGAADAEVADDQPRSERSPRTAKDAAPSDAPLRDAALPDAAIPLAAAVRDAAAPDASPNDASLDDATVDAAPVDAGHPNDDIVLGFGAAQVDASWEMAALPPDRWQISTVTVPEGEQLEVLALQAVLGDVPTPSDGRTIRFGLWSDTNDAGGHQPGTLIAHTSLKLAVDGSNSLPITASRKPALTAGAVYWVGINMSSTGSTLARRIGSGDEVTLSAPLSDVPVDTLKTFPDVAPTYGTSDYALSISCRVVP
jgi:hypothetical protein